MCITKCVSWIQVHLENLELNIKQESLLHDLRVQVFKIIFKVHLGKLDSILRGTVKVFSML